jgi:hypothetical protein
MYDSASFEAAAIFAPPLAAISANPPSMTGNPYGGKLGKLTRIGWLDCLHMGADAVKLNKAKEACQQELNRCNNLNDPTGLDQLNCEQHFATKYGSPASVGWAKNRCACQKSGVCPDLYGNAIGCPW